MSYILDALKKAEEERKRGIPPDVTTLQDAGSVRGRSARPAWVYVLLAAVLLNVVILIWWLGAWNGERAGRTVPKVKSEGVMTTAGTAKSVSDKAPVLSPPAVKGAETGNAGEAGADSGDKNHPPVEIKTVREAPRQTQAEEAGTRAGMAEKTEIPSEGVKGSEVKTASLEPPDANRIYALNQLPPSIRQDLPDMTMSLHYYTGDPSLRLIIVSGETLRQGQETVKGLRLEKVTPDGAVFDYRHYRFRVGMQQK